MLRVDSHGEKRQHANARIALPKSETSHLKTANIDSSISAVQPFESRFWSRDVLAGSDITDQILGCIPFRYFKRYFRTANAIAFCNNKRAVQSQLYISVQELSAFVLFDLQYVQK